ncbi:hypothetical protein EDB81DRAFT_899796 [Dactylonectria macrodidyma]|uniref:Uncharacterized protein n=1 Tax=Dactylonectria macrodidyma TaxID=307937 RepID=A0A9P9EQZ2_9HYPO|nr:hypothetical protein EDB81DRAFT_899796 [Dactylonectria macrodidyma]
MHNAAFLSSCRDHGLDAPILSIEYSRHDLLADDAPSLASLAQVNSDCRQLARYCQFSEIRINYSSRAQQLLMGLAEAEKAHLAESLDGSQPVRIGIGACVRKVTFATDSYHGANLRRDSDASIWGAATASTSSEERNVLRQQANKSYTRFRALAQLIISLALPNLEALVWSDRFPVDRDFFLHVSRSGARHLKLNSAMVVEALPVEPPLTPKTWPLVSLHLEVTLADDRTLASADETSTGSDTLKTESANPMSTFFGTLFQLCAPTIESLYWSDICNFSKMAISLSSSPISSPRLRRLRLSHVSLDATVFSSFLSSPLRHLELPSSTLAKHGSALLALGPWRDLKSFILAELPTKREPCIQIADFIQQHQQHQHHLEKLYIHELRLTSGFDAGRQCQWLVNHAELQSHFRNLSRLKTLALVRDTYPIPDPGYDAEEYYSVHLVMAEERADARARLELDLGNSFAMDRLNTDDGPERFSEEEVDMWERAHRNRMLTHAEAYATVLPALEWIFCGQRPMGLVRDVETNASPKAVPLTECRDECWTFLEQTFGLATNDPMSHSNT